MVSDSDKHFLLAIFSLIPMNEDLLFLLASHVCIISSKKGTKEITEGENESYIARVTARVLQAAKKLQQVKILYELSVYINKIQ